MKMNRFFIGTLLMGILMTFGACTKCSEEKLSVNQSAPLEVEKTISMDKEAMFLKVKGDYRWYESLILLNDFLDEENDGSIAEVVNIFQSVVCRDESCDTYVFKFQHFADGGSAVDSIHSFWIEDFPLADSLIVIPYEEAYALIQQVNFPKPHSKHVCLRNPIGPLPTNPQWCFGNTQSQLWVDAITGEVKQSNPAFPEGFKMPLGEWP